MGLHNCNNNNNNNNNNEINIHPGAYYRVFTVIVKIIGFLNDC